MTDMQQVQQVERYFKTMDLMAHVDKFPAVFLLMGIDIMIEHTYTQ